MPMRKLFCGVLGLFLSGIDPRLLVARIGFKRIERYVETFYADRTEVIASTIEWYAKDSLILNWICSTVFFLQLIELLT